MNTILRFIRVHETTDLQLLDSLCDRGLGTCHLDQLLRRNVTQLLYVFRFTGVFVRVRPRVLHLNAILILEVDQVAATTTYEGAVSCRGDLNAEYDAVAELCRGFLEFNLQLIDKGGFTTQADFVFRLLARSWAIQLRSTRAELEEKRIRTIEQVRPELLDPRVHHNGR